MPYIPSKDRREHLDSDPYGAEDVAELDYVLTKILLAYLPPEPHFADYNSIIGVVDNVKHEFRRRALDPYEDIKIAVNGDVGYDDLPQNKRH